MLTLIADQSPAAKIEKVYYQRPAVDKDDEQNGAHAHGILFADANLKVIVDRTEPLDPSQAPRLKHFLRGPFTLSVQHHLGSTASQITFNLNLVNPDTYIEKYKGIIIKGAPGVTTMSLAVLPFAEVFKAAIDHNTEKMLKKLRARTQERKVIDLEQARQEITQVCEQRDAEVVEIVTSAFYRHLNGPPDPETQKAVPKHGEELISDTLAMGLSASKGFYKNLWQSMMSFYQPTVHYVAVQQARGVEPSF